uniref:Uncharacterized protein n=1 Tax=Haptolina brevifila TaxID=156173 RepID=A0A7S2FLG3_9EUKA
MHAVNTVLFLLELCVNRLLIRIDAICFLLGWALIYCAYIWVYNAVAGWWPYFFLDLSSWVAIPWYAALLVVHVAAYSIAFSASRLKQWSRPELAKADSPTGPSHTGLIALLPGEGEAGPWRILAQPVVITCDLPAGPGTVAVPKA